MSDALPWLVSRESLRPFERVLLGLFGIAPLWGFWELVIRPWPAAASLAGLPLLGMGLVALALAGILLAAALLGPEREVHVDPQARLIRDSGRATFIGAFGRAYRFDEIETIDLQLDRQTEGPDRLQLVLRLRGRRRSIVLLTRPLADRPEIEALAERLRLAVQP
jgi:hypothetical protein